MYRRTAEILGLLLLVSYVFAGASLVPFHMDESALISVGRDPFGRAGSEPDSNARVISKSRGLVLVNGTVPTYAMMLSWKASGFTTADLNGPWIWGSGSAWNQTNGRVPSSGLLLAARRPSVLFTAASVLLIFALARGWAGPRAAWISCILFATHSSVLVHGRRAMMEGPFLFFGLTAVLAAVAWAGREAAGERRTGRREVTYALALAVASGFAVASKHSAFATIAGAYAALLAVTLRSAAANWKRRLGWVMASGVASVLVFLALNPAWWDAPFSRPREVLELRRSIIASQVAAFADHAYVDYGDRAIGLLTRLSADGPEYYEAPSWARSIDAEVRAYHNSPWSGVSYGGGAIPAMLGFGLFAATALGAVRLVREAWGGDARAWVLVAWAAASAAFVIFAIPLNWQRYYVPLYPIQMLLAGAGASGLIAIARRRWLRDVSRVAE